MASRGSGSEWRQGDQRASGVRGIRERMAWERDWERTAWVGRAIRCRGAMWPLQWSGIACSGGVSPWEARGLQVVPRVGPV